MALQGLLDTKIRKVTIIQLGGVRQNPFDSRVHPVSGIGSKGFRVGNIVLITD